MSNIYTKKLLKKYFNKMLKEEYKKNKKVKK